MSAEVEFSLIENGKEISLRLALITSIMRGQYPLCYSIFHVIILVIERLHHSYYMTLWIDSQMRGHIILAERDNKIAVFFDHAAYELYAWRDELKCF